MLTIRIIWKWLKTYWYIPVLFLVTGVVWFLFRKPGTVPWTQTQAELEAITAGVRAQEMELAVGTEKAKVAVDEKYQVEREKLDEKQKKQAEELKDDPAKLAKFLVRAGRKSRTR